MAAKSIAEWEQILDQYSDDEDDDEKPEGALFNNVELLSQLASIVPKENVPDDLKASHEDLVSRVHSAGKAAPLSTGESNEASVGSVASGRTAKSSVSSSSPAP